ncbi:MAG: hypothetical protein WA150_05265, partial [Methylovirgula sp.]
MSRLIAFLAIALAAAGVARADPPSAVPSNMGIAPVIPPGGLLAPRTPAEPQVSRSTLLLSAFLSASDAQPVRGGLVWRVFDEAAQADGSHRL